MHLPLEILVKIFDSCTDCGVFSKIFLVCKDWKKALEMSKKWKYFILIKFAINYDLFRELSFNDDGIVENNIFFNNKIMHVENEEELVPQTNIFKEKVIDALSDKLPVNMDEFNFDIISKYPKIITHDVFLTARNRVCGDIFMYPTGCRVLGQRPEDKYGYKYNYNKIKGYVVCVPTWIASNKSENWNRHGHPLIGDIDEYLPYKLFLGKKEGDTVEFKFKGWDIKLRLRQKPYRYGNKRYDKEMPFEKMMKSNLAASGNICLDSNFPLTYDEQKQLLEKARVEYAKSLE